MEGQTFVGLLVCTETYADWKIHEKCNQRVHSALDSRRYAEPEQITFHEHWEAGFYVGCMSPTLYNVCSASTVLNYEGADEGGGTRGRGTDA